MSCTADYPTAPCPFGFEGKVTRTSCGACKNFIPPRHILSWCSLYDRDGTICQLPKSACVACPFKVEKANGRPPGEGKVDWNDPVSVAKYHSEWRAANDAKVKDAAARFKANHPDYQQKYYEAKKKRENAKAT